MKKKHLFLMPLSFVFLLPLVASLAIDPKTEDSKLGVWEPIKNLSDPHVKEVAEFAVEEYNKESKTDLELQEIESGEMQVVAGRNYKLVLVVLDGGSHEKYEAVVYERPWTKFMKLVSFKPLEG